MKRLLQSIAIASLFISVLSWAAVEKSLATAHVSIGVVDMSSLMKNSPQMTSFNKSLEKKFSEKRSQIENRMKALAEEKKSLERNASVMSDDKKSKQQKALKEKELQLSKDKVQFQRDFFSERTKGLTKIYQSIKAVVAKIAQQRQYDIVIDQGIVFYTKEGKNINITEEVMNKLKKS